MEQRKRVENTDVPGGRAGVRVLGLVVDHETEKTLACRRARIAPGQRR